MLYRMKYDMPCFLLGIKKAPTKIVGATGPDDTRSSSFVTNMYGPCGKASTLRDSYACLISFFFLARYLSSNINPKTTFTII